MKDYVNQTPVLSHEKMKEMTAKVLKMTAEKSKNDSSVYVDNSVDSVDFFEKSPQKPTVVPVYDKNHFLQVRLQWYCSGQ